MLLLIANDAPLDPAWLVHPLMSDWADHRECQIGGDFPLVGKCAECNGDVARVIEAAWPINTTVGHRTPPPPPAAPTSLSATGAVETTAGSHTGAAGRPGSPG